MQLRNEIFNVTERNFQELALMVFQFQHVHNAFYRQYCDTLNINASKIEQLDQIPFLPIQFFKTQKITCTEFDPEIIFESSGTTGTVTSRHLVKDILLYEESFLNTFQQFYSGITNYCILGLLPSYLERKNASLVWMVDSLIKKSHHPSSGFFLYDFKKLKQVLQQNENAGQPTILIGVTYALIDFFEKNPLKLKNCIVMETGGMKGRREELTRSEVQQKLISQTGLTAIHAEYGMTELLSQAYSMKDGIFKSPPWMKILLRSEDDPFELILPENIKHHHASAAINIIDLANIYSCSFIATDDMGKLYKDGSFEIMGRLDNSDIRGCSLMLL